MDTYWENKDVEVVKTCGKIKSDVVAQLFITPKVKRKIELLMDKYKSKEWLGYLTGEGNVIQDILIPKQNASGASVDDIEFGAEIKVIGVIHSHHSMGTFFSDTDHEFINGNHNISIVVAHNGSKAQVRVKTACGALMIQEAKITVVYEKTFDEDDFIKDAVDKIDTVYPVYVNDWQHWHDSLGMGWEYTGKRTENENTNKVTSTKEESGNVSETVIDDELPPLRSMIMAT